MTNVNRDKEFEREVTRIRKDLFDRLMSFAGEYKGQKVESRCEGKAQRVCVGKIYGI